MTKWELKASDLVRYCQLQNGGALVTNQGGVAVEERTRHFSTLTQLRRHSRHNTIDSGAKAIMDTAFPGWETPGKRGKPLTSLITLYRNIYRF